MKKQIKMLLCLPCCASSYVSVIFRFAKALLKLLYENTTDWVSVLKLLLCITLRSLFLSHVHLYSKLIFCMLNPFIMFCNSLCFFKSANHIIGCLLLYIFKLQVMLLLYASLLCFTPCIHSHVTLLCCPFNVQQSGATGTWDVRGIIKTYDNICTTLHKMLWDRAENYNPIPSPHTHTLKQSAHLTQYWSLQSNLPCLRCPYLI